MAIKTLLLKQGDPRGKRTPPYEGPFVVIRAFKRRSYISECRWGRTVESRQLRQSEEVLRLSECPQGFQIGYRVMLRG